MPRDSIRYPPPGNNVLLVGWKKKWETEQKNTVSVCKEEINNILLRCGPAKGVDEGKFNQKPTELTSNQQNLFKTAKIRLKYLGLKKKLEEAELKLQKKWSFDYWDYLYNTVDHSEAEEERRRREAVESQTLHDFEEKVNDLLFAVVEGRDDAGKVYLST